MKKRSLVWLVLCSMVVSIIPSQNVLAYAKTDYVAKLIVVHAPSVLQVGKEATVEMTVKNVGKAPWIQKGKNEVSLYHYDSKRKTELDSVFRVSNWVTAERPSLLPVAKVQSGETVTWRFVIKAPQKTGNYSMEFIPVAEDLVRMGGGKASFSIQVTAASVATSVKSPSTVSVPSALSSDGYSGFLLLRSDSSMTVAGNERKQFTFGFKNNGTSLWKSRSVKIGGLQPALGDRLGSIRDTSWIDDATPVSITGDVKPGELGFVTFNVKGPAKAGSYTARFQLYADNQSVEGAFVEIPITVTSDAAIASEPTVATAPTPTTNNQVSSPNAGFVLNPQPLNGDSSSLPEQPIIRAGLLEPADYQMEIVASHIELTVLNNGSIVCSVPLQEKLTVSYDKVNTLYTLTSPSCGIKTSSLWYVVRATDGVSPMTLADYVRPVSWLPGANDNTFRGQLELRYASKPDQIWVINELPIEYYLRGIAETSNISPAQYQRALLTAARTYAMYHVNRGTKHASQNFTVDATYDQVYRGYGQEARSPNIVAAIEATRGQIVTYNGKLAVTPFFSRSDGMTRNYEDVWGPTKIDWLKAVPAPGDEGKTLWGHGVGLSASSALYMDSKLGKTYEEILKHFYTGTDLRKAYR